MDKKHLTYGLIALAVVLVIVFVGRRQEPVGQPGVQGPENSASTTASGSSQPQTPAGSTTGGGTVNSGTKPQTNATARGVTVTSPVAGAQWVIGNLYEISWSKGIAVTGGAALVDGNKTVVGWITPSLKQFQSSFSWDGQYMTLSRTNPSRVLVQPGTYTIRVTFDQGAGTIESPTFSLLAPGQGSAIQTVTIQSGYLAPAKITAKRGEKVLFVNKDDVAYELWLSTFLQQTIPAGGSWTLDTGPLDRTVYAVSAKNRTSVQGTLVVQ